MSHRLKKISAFWLLICLLGLLNTACSESNKGTENGNKAAATNNATGVTNTTSVNNTASPAGSSTSPASAESQQIEMNDDLFQPAQLTVPVGTKVTWVNKGKKAHTVVSNDQLFDSGLVNAGGQFSYTYTAPGTYSYHCAPHPKMIGQIIVK